MAVTTVFDGTLAANTNGSWVAVPSSRAYTMQVVGGLGFDLSVDGVTAMPLNQKPTLISPSGSQPLAFSLVDVPIAWMRATNGSSASVIGKIYVQAQ